MRFTKYELLFSWCLPYTPYVTYYIGILIDINYITQFVAYDMKHKILNWIEPLPLWLISSAEPLFEFSYLMFVPRHLVKIVKLRNCQIVVIFFVIKMPSCQNEMTKYQNRWTRPSEVTWRWTQNSQVQF